MLRREKVAIAFDDPIKQEIWLTVRSLNDVWTKGNPDDLVNYFHRDMIAITATDRYRREGRAMCLEGWKGFAQAATIHRWEEINPVIHVYGDSAVVAYNFDMSFDMGGHRIDLGGRDMFFFVKENGQWWAVADQYSAYPC